MSGILKTLPTRFARGELERFLGVGAKPCFNTYYFTLGRGRPRRPDPCTKHPTGELLSLWEAETFTEWWYCPACSNERGFRSVRPAIDDLYFTHQGMVIGHFRIQHICRNAGQLPPLTNMDGDPSAWQIPGDAWVAVCLPPWHPIEDQIYHTGFQGWRYFDLQKYRGTYDARICL